MKRFPPLPPKISEGATCEFLLRGKRFDIFYVLKGTPIFIKQPLCDNRTFSLTTSFICPSSRAEGASGRKRLFYPYAKKCLFYQCRIIHKVH